MAPSAGPMASHPVPVNQNAKRAVRISAALLVAGSLAACGGLPSVPGFSRGDAVVQPLSREVRSGLPEQPGQDLLDTLVAHNWPQDFVREDATLAALDENSCKIAAPFGLPKPVHASQPAFAL